MTPDTSDQTRPSSRRVLADMVGLLLILAGLVGIAYFAFQAADWAGGLVVCLYLIGLGVGLANDTSSG